MIRYAVKVEAKKQLKIVSEVCATPSPPHLVSSYLDLTDQRQTFRVADRTMGDVVILDSQPVETSLP